MRLSAPENIARFGKKGRFCYSFQVTPEEQALLKKLVKQSEENNRMLHGIRSHMRWSVAWGFVKFLLIAIPLVIGYFYVEKNLNAPTSWIDQAKEIIDSVR